MHKIIGKFAVVNIGDADTDGDGVIDSLDYCDWTRDTGTVNSSGCDWSQQDEDMDGVSNSDDDCLGTDLGYEVDDFDVQTTKRTQMGMV